MRFLGFLYVLMLSALTVSSCTLTVAQGFQECRDDSECVTSSTCIDKYCVKLPDGCQRGAGDFKDPNRITFAALVPLTNQNGKLDERQAVNQNAFALALDEMNQRGGANGRHFALIVCDTLRDKTRTQAQATWMVNQLHVPAILASGSQQCIDISEVTRQSNTMIMSATATSAELVTYFSSSAQRLLWRTAPPDTIQAQVLANLLLTAPIYSSAQKFGIVYVDDPYGQGLQAELALRLSGAKMVRSVRFKTGDTNISAILDPISGANKVDATVVIAFNTDTTEILKTAFTRNEFKRASGHRWAFTDASKSAEILKVPGATSELIDSLGTAPAQGTGPVFKTFRESYVNRFGADPISYAFTSHSYDAMYLLGLAASYATTPPRILSGRTMADGMTHIIAAGPTYVLRPDQYTGAQSAFNAGQYVNLDGNSGTLNFIPDAGAPSSQIEIWRIDDGGMIQFERNVEPPAN